MGKLSDLERSGTIVTEDRERAGEATTAPRPAQDAGLLPATPMLIEAKVLLVDDQWSLLFALEETLRDGIPGSTVDACLSAKSALERLAVVDYDVVVTDIAMPEMDGLALLEEIRALRPETLTLVISGAGDADAPARALRRGAYEFIQKPIGAEYFVLLVQRALETRRLRREVDRQKWDLRRRADELERAVEERTYELREANRLKDDFLATLSHELRTPLTAVLGWARLLRKGRLDAERRAEAVSAIERNAAAQARLVDDLLDVSRIISGKLLIESTRVDVAAVIGAAIEAVAPMAEAGGIRIEPRLDPGLGSVMGDAVRLQQTIWNLVANAVKFSPSGGSVTVSARRGERVEIEVRDAGIGIEPSLLPHVFERFRQGDVPIRGARRGLGLGLAIVRHLVGLHGGDVVVASEGEGKGATFTIRLPIPPRESRRTGRSGLFARISSRPDAGDGARPSGCLQGTSVLLVEDDVETRQVLTVELEEAGARVQAVASAAEALRALDERPADVFLCDIGLPDEDGYSLLRTVRTRPLEAGGNVLAVALTAYAKPEDRALALAAGFAQHIAKPGPGDLALRLADLMRQAASDPLSGEAVPASQGPPRSERGA
jgi:signal transduction histidine kinase